MLTKLLCSLKSPKTICLSSLFIIIIVGPIYSYDFNDLTIFEKDLFKKYGYNMNVSNSNDTQLVMNSENISQLLRTVGMRNRINMRGSVYLNSTDKWINCTSVKDFIEFGANEVLDIAQFRQVCPAILLQIVTRVCYAVKKTPDPEPKTKEPNNIMLVWLYSIAAVIICSLVGLVVVWLIPILPKEYYQSISQLLIALAVGSLTGDALLHLIPHALVDDGDGHNHEGGSEHKQMVWKALVALIGIHLFFITERITILCQNINSKRKNRLKQLSQDYSEIPVGCDDCEKVNPNNSIIMATPKSCHSKKQWASKSRKYSGSRHNSESQEADGFGVHLCNLPNTKPHVNSDCPDSMNLALCQESVDANVNNLGTTTTTTTINTPVVEQNVILQFNSDVNKITTTPTAPLESTESTNTINTNNTSNISTFAPPFHNQQQHHNQAMDQNINNNVGAIPQTNTNKSDYLTTVTSGDTNWSTEEDDKLLKLNPAHQHNRIQHHSHNHAHSHNHQPNPDICIQRCDREAPNIGAGGATVISSEAHPYRNRPHGHHHGHSHDLSSVKAIAYTVIAGDGLHNFCDGIAIGAAFANDLKGGLSTAIAVLCHELPHELGDFVVLLHAGMSIRTAIFYNLLSSIFCGAGMIIGVLLGRIPSVSNWIFMLTAGMFLYIALVDMIPELSTRRLQGRKLFHRPSILFLWQNIGLLLGSTIMLLIALYEENMF